MSGTTGIQWTDSTWNPVTGCTKVSPGCDNCYAETFSERWRDTPGHYFEHGFDLMLRPDKLDLPFRWRQPRRVFVNSMSDLFHEQVPDKLIAQVFAVMAMTPQHTYQLLTKRHARMRSLLNRRDFGTTVAVEATALAIDRGGLATLDVTHGEVASGVWYPQWPLPNVWLGVSVETQQWADIRIPALLDTPAAVRFLSCEPLLGPVDLTAALVPYRPERVDWVITGGESGPRARPLDLDWVRTIRDDCHATGVAFFHKQHGGRTPKSGGRELDGRTHDDYPTPTASRA